ncbi:MAG: NFYB/HAP3 family transcription factor subunit [Candidatus Parvarchaeota archaeon]|nr:NFYB/HAP3 family transcription factor subunit [Candidatus Jingweiarchaeum tengchongense]MCW1298367.1 NFYB/HAP3 family transcription factor subunit [Candidatus Jingweiarchaeum tengchongense]MCW1300331.1 NFYB/HAP3 family transcription factor subunit [Candidatus Jingweiarchaeum tengchongense]MCW1304872.1 NFYB/HAP3 family transcription factor subunit [Candidatus Jingweiarchaeum tengchongense]MCW1305827.1 NFYB/HAP3 family transcription factor subunit [Candidatus Jingweiarchaeum tengchongense]
MVLPLATMEKIIKKGGAERVGEDAKQALAEVLEEIAIQISARAATLAKHAGRKTIKLEDIEIAKKEILE